MLLFAKYLNLIQKAMRIIKRTESKKPYPQTYFPIRSIFDDFFAPTLWEDFPTQNNIASLNADLWEKDQDIFIKMALPGVKKEDIEITINEDSITIKGSTKDKEERDDTKKYYFKSMESSFEQTFNLPTKVDAGQADAKFEDGVLNIKLPKADEVKPKQIEVK